MTQLFEKRTGRVAEIAIAFVALGVFGTFLGLIAWRVPQMPLVIIFSLIFCMAAFDFWSQLKGDGTPPKSTGESDSQV